MPSNDSRNKTQTSLQGACGRADLVAALADGDAALASALADLMGFERQILKKESEASKKSEKSSAQKLDEGESEQPEIVFGPQPEIPFWQLIRYRFIEQEEPDVPPLKGLYRDWKLRPEAPPTIPPLACWCELEPKLRRLLCLLQPGAAIDMDLMVQHLSEARLLAELPHERRHRWGPTLYLIEDRSSRLIPYRLDQYLVYAALRRLLPAQSLVRRIWRGDISAPSLPEGGVGSIVLVLGDLGCLSNVRSALCEQWLHFGRDLRAAGCIPVALIPGPLTRCPRQLAKVWQLIPWERPRPWNPEDTLKVRAERLLQLVSPAVRIEPGLLRAARLLLPPDCADAGTEADVWQHPDLISRSAAGATLNPERAKALGAAFASQFEPELQSRFASLLRSWRGYLPKEIWFEELLNLPHAAQTAAEVAQDLPYARDYFAEFVRDCGDEGASVNGNDLEWFSRVGRRAERLWRDKQVGDDLKRLSYVLHGQDSNYRFPADFRPDLIRQPDRRPRRLVVRQQGEMLEWVAAEASPSGSYLADCTSRNGLIQVESLPTDRDPSFWRSGQPPSWADDWGTDEYGHWGTFSIENQQGKKITQRMRWIKPGTFLMGSPENEPERRRNEGPQHSVTIRQGYWLFDTACTQALWEAVMGENPSGFKGPDHPVESISWRDCQNFLKRLNQRLPGLDLTLPSEAQWEYACRADTTTPFSFGINITLEQVNYDGNYPYAGGKKGLYRQQTVPVASLPPNRWGLYEMHGNVREWCQDHWHDDYQGAPADGSAWEEGRDTDTDRVLRGGSWSDNTRNMRAAFRYRVHPVGHYVNVGFRCAQVRGEPSQEGVSSAEPTLLRLDAGGFPLRCALPQAPTFHIRTDREHLRFCRLTKPVWASAIGRDRFGLWCEIAIEPERGGEPVIQRLRWIPPGRFWMGSPKEEPGHISIEGPRHLVMLTEGYWLFDTPCTQALWEAVMDKNPSRFQSPTRPVERVSWNDVQDFMKKINDQNQYLDLDLPSEAQWEYACRAGTETAIYTGDLDILGERNAPALDPIAWYSGNSEGQTHPIKRKRANSWGLYDILGNVWEWCRDGMRDYDQNTQMNPMGLLTVGTRRVLRGGSWDGYARNVRAACRYHGYPGDHIDYTCFRCARVRDTKAT